METPYKRLNCDIYDELELRALRHTPCELVIRNESDELICLRGIIADIRAHHGEEFLVLETGETIRLDQLVTIDGKEAYPGCEI